MKLVFLVRVVVKVYVFEVYLLVQEMNPLQFSQRQLLLWYLHLHHQKYRRQLLLN